MRKRSPCFPAWKGGAFQAGAHGETEIYTYLRCVGVYVFFHKNSDSVFWQKGFGKEPF